MKILTYPNTIAGGQRALHYVKALKCPFTKDPSDPEITHLWHYNYSNRVDACPPELTILKEKLGTPIINEYLLNIKKDYVDDVFSSIFEYSIRIDPTEHYGMIAIKSSQNAVHGMKLIQGPISPEQVDRRARISHNGEPHYRQYQRFIDTRISADIIRDFRLVVIGGEVVLLMEKHLDYRCLAHPRKGLRFDVYAHTKLDRFFSRDEQFKINEWIDEMRIEFGEVDILRDNSTGLMYIIDINPVPAGAAINHLHPDQVMRLSQQFKKAHLQ